MSELYKQKPTINAQDYIAGLGKGLAILECFDSQRQRLSVTMAAEKTGMTRAAARRYLLTLTYLGYLENEGQYYYLTPKILKFASAYLSSSSLAKVAQPLLNLLTVQTGHVCSVMVLEGHKAIAIVRSHITQLPSQTKGFHPYGVNLGHRLPAYATAAGKILLAFLEEHHLQEWFSHYPLKPLTKNTMTEPDVLKQKLREIKSQEWCYAKEEHELGIHAIAVPILNTQGQIVAALNMVASPTSCSPKILQNQMLPLLQNTARELRQIL